MKIYIYLMLMLIVVNFSNAQGNDAINNELKPYRIGLKIGAINVLSLDLEYVTPLFNNRVAPFIDLSSLRYRDGEDTYRSNIFEFGTNIYLNNKGDGKDLYGSLSYGHINFKMDRIDYELDDGRQFSGVAKSETKVNLLNIKVGAKFGDKFYFRTEIGYGFGKIPESIKSTGIIDGNQTTAYEDISEDLKDFPTAGKNGTLLFNIGFGFEFKGK